jgi:hypothetical protein
VPEVEDEDEADGAAPMMDAEVQRIPRAAAASSSCDTHLNSSLIIFNNSTRSRVHHGARLGLKEKSQRRQG